MVNQAVNKNTPPQTGPGISGQAVQDGVLFSRLAVPLRIPASYRIVMAQGKAQAGDISKNPAKPEVLPPAPSSASLDINPIIIALIWPTRGVRKFWATILNE
ncbi:MAG: hypothetical protein NZ602_11040 [Thermoguttaceae bacterium]|nr:hypothetical protein [Thermoguttaceae bacterium]MDW8038528.1 hypothetical protein [Thermoguttaceae bacterium]